MNEEEIKLKKILSTAAIQLIPPEYILPSDFTEKHIPIIDGPLAGSRTRLFPFQREMIDAVDDENYQRVVYMTSAQVSKTTILNSQLCHLIANHNDNIIVAQATLNDLRSWRNTKIEKVFEAVPPVLNKLPPKRSKEFINNEAMTQRRDGKYIYYVTLGSLSALRGKTARYIIVDELAAADQLTDEGSPLALLEQRQTTFGMDRKIIISSTPTYKNDPIHLEFQQSDQRHYYVPCPHCGEHQLLEWENVKLLSIEDPNDPTGRGRKVADGAMYYCPHCKESISDGEKRIMVSKGEWRKHNEDPNCRTAGFYINRLYSPFASWETVAIDFLDALAKNSYQSFINTSLGLPWTDVDDELDEHELMGRRELFDADDIPDEALLITAGTDIQKDRIETTLVAWGDGEEAYVFKHHVEFGDTEGDESDVWNRYDEFLKTKFMVNGKKMRIAAVSVDSGYMSDQVMKWCNQRKGRGIFAVKGSSLSRDRFIPQKISKSSKAREFRMLGVTQGKDIIFRRLNGKKKGRNSFRFSHVLDRDYFEMLTAEEARTRLVKGFSIREYHKIRKRNEALDCLLYALSAMKLINPNWESLTTSKPIEEVEEEIDVIEEIKQLPPIKVNRPINQGRPRKGGWLDGY